MAYFKRRHRYSTMDNVWYFAASCVFVFLFGNLIMLHSYRSLVDNSTGDRDTARGQNRGSGHLPDESVSESQISYSRLAGRAFQGWGANDDVYNIKQLSRELLANRNLFQRAHPASEYFVMESRLRKLLENHSANATENINNKTTLRSSSPSASASSFYRFLDFSFGPGMLDCGEIETVAEKQYIASGWTKAVFKGVIPSGKVAVLGGRKVALKTVDIGGQDVTLCMDKGNSLQYCYHRAAEKIVKEIVLLQALSHDNILQVLGFCVPDRPYDGDGDTTVVMVTELGEPIDLIKLLQMSWEDRLRISYDLTRLLHFLSQSARGALVMNDFRRQQFVLVDGVLKLSDVDDAGFEEPPCSAHWQCDLHFSSANFTKHLRCVAGRCQGYNEYRNMFNAGRHFTTFLLPHGAPPTLRPLVDRVVRAFQNCSLTTKELMGRMTKVVELFRSGAYLNRTRPQQSLTGYQGLEYSDLPGQYDYRCRMSMAGGGCTLSVFDQREAEDLCDADPDCKAFVWTDQHTWTGRTLVHLKNGVGPASRNPNTRLLLKNS